MGHEPGQCLLQLLQVKAGVEQGQERGPGVKILVLSSCSERGSREVRVKPGNPQGRGWG